FFHCTRDYLACLLFPTRRSSDLAVGAVRAMPGNRATAVEPCDARWTGPRRAKQAAAGGPVHADRTGRWADRPPGGADHTGRARCAATPAGTDAPAAGLFGGASFGQARNAWAAPGRLQGRAASVWAYHSGRVDLRP